MGIIIFAITIVLILIKRVKLSFAFLLVTFFAIPYNGFLQSIFLVNMFGVDFRIIALILLFLYTLLLVITGNHGLVFYKFDLIVIAFYLTIFVYTFVGISNNNPYIMEDLQPLIILFLVYFITRCLLNSKKDVAIINKVLVLSSFLYSIVVIVIYFVFDNYLNLILGETLFSWWGRRVSFGNTTLSIYVFIYILFQALQTHKITFYRLATLILSLMAILISQNRTIIACLVAMIFFSIVINMFYSNNKLTVFKNNITIFVIPFVISLSLLVIVSNYSFIQEKLGDMEIIQSLTERIFEEDLSTVDVRKISNDYALNESKNSQIGYGIGKELTLLDENYVVHSEGPFIDNVFFTYLVKIGIIGLTLLLVLTIIPLIKSIVYLLKYTKPLNNEMTILYLYFPFFIVITAIMNAQLLYSLPAVIFYAVFSNIILVVGSGEEDQTSSL